MKITISNKPGRKAYKLAQSPGATPEELKDAVLRLHARIDRQSKKRSPVFNWEKYKANAAKACFEKRAELQGAGEINPLDDDEKLKEIRLLLFGSAPE